MTTQGINPPLSPIDNWKSVMTTKYAKFDGRARRSEFWWFVVVNVVIGVVLQAFAYWLSGGLSAIFWVLDVVFVLATFIPGLALAFRRLHDTNKSAWFLLVAFSPLVGFIILLVFYFIDSDRTANNYGPSPKYAS
jgi:uncharacterized membrane protein YhaH (DUF805 family)